MGLGVFWQLQRCWRLFAGLLGRLALFSALCLLSDGGLMEAVGQRQRKRLWQRSRLSTEGILAQTDRAAQCNNNSFKVTEPQVETDQADLALKSKLLVACKVFSNWLFKSPLPELRRLRASP